MARANVPGRCVLDDDALIEPGDYFIGPDGDYVFYVCPCGCGEHMYLPIGVGPKVDHKWLWDGTRDPATLQPSIKRLDRCKFHGFLTGGVWTFASDSGQ